MMRSEIATDDLSKSILLMAGKLWRNNL